MGLTKRATQLPLTAISFGLQAWEQSRGLREFAVRRGGEALQLIAATPLGRLLPEQLIGDGAEEEAARLVEQVRADEPAATRDEATPKPPPEHTKPEHTKPEPAKPEPVTPPAAARAVGAPGAVAAEVEQITEQLDLEPPQSREDLPIPDFDNISLGSLRARLRSLSLDELVLLREWEQAHAHRLQVLTTLDNRIAKIGGTPAPTGSDYPQEASPAEKAAESEGGTLRV